MREYAEDDAGLTADARNILGTKYTTRSISLWIRRGR